MRTAPSPRRSARRQGRPRSRRGRGGRCVRHRRAASRAPRPGGRTPRRAGRVPRRPSGRRPGGGSGVETGVAVRVEGCRECLVDHRFHEVRVGRTVGRGRAGPTPGTGPSGRERGARKRFDREHDIRGHDFPACARRRIRVPCRRRVPPRSPSLRGAASATDAVRLRSVRRAYGEAEALARHPTGQGTGPPRCRAASSSGWPWPGP